MKSVRKISKIWKSKPAIEGAGVHLKRAFGYNQVPMFDPFLMLDDFHSNYPPHYVKGFQSTPPRGGRRTCCTACASAGRGFNPRPRVGGDVSASARSCSLR